MAKTLARKIQDEFKDSKLKTYDDLAAATRIDRATVTQVVQMMVSSGEIRESSPGLFIQEKGGKNAHK